jgi:hydroxymethylpyrimidine pyrophosphatase-like HAD family hydrolase
VPSPRNPPPNPDPPAKPGLSLHLVSDLDGTWLPSPGQVPGLRRLEAFLQAQPGIVLTMATGRGLASALEALAALGGHLPLHLVTDVGTALHHRTPGGGWAEDAAFARWVEARWPADLGERLARAGYPPGVRSQPEVPAGRRLALELHRGNLARAAAALRRTLDRLGSQVEVLPSNGVCLDVLPPGVDKGSAIEHMRLPLPVVACGDSENDLGLWRVADRPVLMADSAIAPGFPGVPWQRLVRPRAPGPEGILEVLLDMWRHGEAV